jgi:hypothetical protein
VADGDVVVVRETLLAATRGPGQGLVVLDEAGDLVVAAEVGPSPSALADTIASIAITAAAPVGPVEEVSCGLLQATPLMFTAGVRHVTVPADGQDRLLVDDVEYDIYNGGSWTNVDPKCADNTDSKLSWAVIRSTSQQDGE